MTLAYDSFAIPGIDISQYNGVIDWAKITSVTHKYIIPRGGFGKVTDSKFDVNWAELLKTSIARAIYWYIDYYSNHNVGSGVYGIGDAEWGIIQAEACWDKIKDNPCFVWADIESASPALAPTITTVSTRVQTIAKAFLERMDELNKKKNGIYCSVGLLSWFSSWFKDRPLWVAWYNEYQTTETVRASCVAAGWNNMYIWQWSSQQQIDGIGQCDTNAFLGTAAEFAVIFGSSPVVVVTPEDETSEGEEITEEPVKTETVEYMVNTARLNIRALPTTASSILGMLYSGTPVVCSKEVDLGVGSDQGWVKVDGQEQYLSLDYLKLKT